MVRGCADARYEPFNLGEALVTRCSIALGEFQGHAYVLGDEPEKCLAAALADALAQDCRYLEGVEHLVLALEDDLARERETELKKTRATRVDFFTLVRGEDAS
jgi:alpha-D-ribose 1-methylphosphonate 5-triphosphate synthase subunit PhnG